MLGLLHDETMAPGHTQRYMLKKEAVVGGYPTEKQKNGEYKKAFWYVLDGSNDHSMQFARAMALISETPVRLQKEASP